MGWYLRAYRHTFIYLHLHAYLLTSIPSSIHTLRTCVRTFIYPYTTHIHTHSSLHPHKCVGMTSSSMHTFTHFILEFAGRAHLSSQDLANIVNALARLQTWPEGMSRWAADAALAMVSSHPTCCTLHPTPWTLYPTPFHPTPCALHPAPYLLYPRP